MSSFSQEEIEEFKVEAQELMDLSEKSLLALDQGGDFKTCFDSIFRGFHNLKGGAGMMEFLELQSHTHELETIFMSFKEKTSIPKNYINFFLRGIDAARTILDGEKVEFDFTVKDEAPISETKVKEVTAINEEVKQEEPKISLVSPEPVEVENPSSSYEIPDEVMAEFLAEVEEIIENISQKLQKIEKKNYDRELVDNLYRDVHSLKGSAYLFSFHKMGDIAHAMESSLEGVRNGTHLPSERLLDCLFKSLRVLEALAGIMKKKECDESFAKVVPVVVKALAVSAEKLEKVPESKVVEESNLSEDMANELADLIEEGAIVNEVVPKIEESVMSIPAQTSVVKEKEAEGASSIRVPVALLDNLMTLMGEMVLVRNQVLQYSNKAEDLEFSSMSKRLNVVTSEIQEEMMKTRMQPIGNVLEKFNRVVRDLSHDLKKSINLVIQGAETELDKSLLESVKDPLTHIVRNSCDHGIELPEVRKQAGKQETGTIAIKSYHEGGQVVIEITDDGKGLHKDQLIKKAIEKGIINSAQASTLSDKEAYDLIFAPGFSTAAQITNVSGRGVGMDVVRTNIEKIGGTVELSGKAGAGTSIKIKIPLTLAIVPALIVKCGKETFSIPQVKIEELVRVDPESENKIEMLHGAPVYRLRGDILPLVDLNKVLGLEKEREDYKDRAVNIAILNAENFSFGVIVDEIQDTVDIVVKPINRLLKSLQVYAGATILGDGSISLIFDVMGISKMAQLGQAKDKSSKVEDSKQQKLSDMQELLLVRLNSPTKHALALNYVQRLEEFKEKEIEYSGDQRAIRYRGNILPLVSVNEQLGYELNREKKDTVAVVVIERAGKLYGVEVNEILDTFSTLVELKEPIKKHNGIFGNINTDEELIVVIDPYEVISQAFDLEDLDPKFDVKAEARSIALADKSGTILLVEDTVYFRKAIKAVLEKRGYTVVLAQDGQEALEILSQNPGIDLIVSDIEMPRMNGFQMAKEIRKHSSYSKIPLLAVSSKADKDYRREGMNSGFDMYLEKLKPEVLLAAISELYKVERKAA
ncbi:MAG: chemotaxis protein CheW [Bacteriovoracaceae bacterium]